MNDFGYLANQANLIRQLVLDITFRAKIACIGGNLSIADILATLYFGGIMRIDPQNPHWSDRDKFILSKGHGCSAFYATLGLKGFFPHDWLDNYGKDGSRLASHCTLHSLPGIETTTGSLGHGLAVGIGLGLDALKNNRLSRIFVLMGDGECQEGSVWESMMFAGYHKINNLVMIIDNNNLQAIGYTNDILSIEPLEKKIASFGWSVERVNGHSLPDLSTALNHQDTQPRAIIAQTIKGKGISFMENSIEWHNICLSEEQYFLAKKELKEERCEVL